MFGLAKFSLTCIELKCTEKNLQFVTSRNIWASFSHWGVLGKRTLNPEVLKCHEDLITLDTYVQQGEILAYIKPIIGF